MEARQEWQPTPVFLPGESLDRVAESDITDYTRTHTHTDVFTGESMK